MSFSFNSDRYFRNISDKLASLIVCVKQENSLNLTSLNIHAENFFIAFLNCLMDWNLENVNATKKNAEGIDLWDKEKQIVVQVSSTNTYQKIQHSLDNIEWLKNAHCTFYFIAINDKLPKFKNPFQAPNWLEFDPEHNILSQKELLDLILNKASKDIEKMKKLSALMDQYFGSSSTAPKSQCLTRMPERTTTKQVICRDKELGDIKDKLQRGENILLMSGFGGIGKTALARLVFHEVKEHYDEVAWISYNRCLKDSMLFAIQILEDVKDQEERWNAILNLKNNGKSKLFVIDNADRDEKTGQLPQDDRDLNALTGWPNTTVIVTSRLEELAPYSPHPIDFLSKEACVKLFYQYYPNDPEQTQKDAVEKLVELAKYHTLTVELFAKGAGREHDLSAYYNKLQKSFASASLKVRVSHNDEMNTIVGHLKILFDMKRRSRKEKRVLWDFAVLPTDAALTSEEAELWFRHDANVLDQLAQDGWLSWTGKHYTMHPLVKEILLLDKVPKRTAKVFLFLAAYSSIYFQDNEVYTETLRKLELAESVVAAVCHRETSQLAHILHNMGMAYRRVGQYQKAKERYERAITIKEAKLGTDHPDTTATYNNIALVYQDMGDLPKALEFYEKDLAISGAKLGKDHPDTATTYNNIALVYDAMGDLPKALEFYEKALSIVKAKLGEDHPHTAATYNGIALVYQAMGDFPKALEFFEKDLAISEAKLGKDHPDTAITYNNIAGVYYAMGDLPKALEFFEKDLAISEAKLGEDHPNTAITYHNIGTLYYAQKDYATAKAYLLMALKILLVKLGAGHPRTKTTLGWLSACYKAEHGSEEGFIPWLMEQLNEEARQLLSAWAEASE